VRVVDWLGRTLLLVMAGLATLSIVASVASVSNIHGSPPPRPGSETVAERLEAPQKTPPVEPRQRVSSEAPVGESEDDGVLAALSAADVQDGEIARWLESLTYAVLALAGFMAAALIVLLRITALLARIAERR
jgi:hypothetical protein